MTKQTLLFRFSITAGILFLGWTLLYYLVLIPYTRVNSILTDTVLEGTYFGLNLLGYTTTIEGNVVSIANQPTVLIQDGCNGLELFALYAGFILAFPGRWTFKAIFIPSGIALIYVINVLRNMALSLNYRFFQETFEFNHKYTYVLIVYLVVFLLWRYWMNRFSVLAHK